MWRLFLLIALFSLAQLWPNVAVADEARPPREDQPPAQAPAAGPRIAVKVEVLEIELKRLVHREERLQAPEMRQISAARMLEIASALSEEELAPGDPTKVLRWLSKQKLAKPLIGPVQLAVASGETASFAEGGATRVPSRGEMVTVEFGTRVALLAKATEAGPLTLVVSPQLTVMDTLSALRFEGREYPGFKRSTIKAATELVSGETAYFWGPLEEQQFWTDTDSPEGPKAEWQDPTRREGVRILMSLTAEIAHGPPR